MGMIVVNAAAYFHYAGEKPVFGALLHAQWDGFRFADLVFPAFIFIVGVSIALSLTHAKDNPPKRAEAYRHIAIRSAKLFIFGVVLSNIYTWFSILEFSEVRYLGVLQRIALAYFFTAMIFLHAPRRIQTILCLGALVLYWPITLAPIPGDGPVDLNVAGMNVVSWVDRTVLGNHAYYKGVLGYDPEGLLSTLPVIAQCTMGALFGGWLQRRTASKETALRIAGAGAICFVIGAGWGIAFPIIKDLWTSSYVLLSTGLTLLVYAAIYWIVEVRWYRGVAVQLFVVVGVNAISAYALHHLLSFLLVSAPMIASYTIAAQGLPEEIASLMPVMLFCILIWLPVNWLYNKDIIIKI